MKVSEMNVYVAMEYDGNYHAYDENTYDCDCDQDGYYSTSPVGSGRSALDAVAELLEMMEDE